ncbi:peptidylprolyl isomerase [Umezawaea sp. NPDC059074]|uniref:peptidylprolyl isomerase n=1 Tax=Umezawaea sp. NPDC059074 TaxID=3346716 RepID=UPI0036955F6F
MPKPLLVIAVAAVLSSWLLSGCATSVNGKPVAGAAPAAAGPTCDYAVDTSPGAVTANGFPATVSNQKKSTVSFATPQGVLAVDLDPSLGPCSVEAIRFLVKKKFYDGSSCHRLTTNPSLQVLQCGDPSGSGTGTPGFRYDDKLPVRGDYVRGVVAMANAGPGTNGSQFFIVYGAAQINPDYPVVGKVSSGMDLVDAVVAGGVVGGKQDGKPVKPMTFTSVTEG